jgi:formylglycine-generating enzyme required for sulfatase activity
MWEWVMDWYSDTYYTQWATANSCNNCANISPTSSARVIRGGSWYYDATAGLRAAYRYPYDTPTGRYNRLGFRCARSAS